MSKVVKIYKTGPSEVMKFEDIHIHEPGEGEVKIEHTAIGLNFIDVYYRSGLYPIDNFPITLGMEGAGIIKSIGNKILVLCRFAFSKISGIKWKPSSSNTDLPIRHSLYFKNVKAIPPPIKR